jgi:hypothetical protein
MPEKADDFAILYTFLAEHPDNPGLYVSGDNVAQEWATLTGASALALRSNYMNFTLQSGDHVAVGDPLSPLLVSVGSCFTHEGVPDSLIACGGCTLVTDFDVLTATGSSVPELQSAGTSNTYVVSQVTTNSVGSTARVMLSGFSYDRIRDQRPGFPPARVDHLRDVLNWLENGVGEPTSVASTGQLADYLRDNYPNPFNPTTTIRYGIKTRSLVSLRIYDVAGRLVTTLVNEVQTPAPEGLSVEWSGRNDAGQQVASGVYFYRLVTEGFTKTKKMVLLK